MKKVLIICLLSLLIVGSLCADWQRIIGLSESPIPPEKNVMKSDTSGLFIRTMVFGFTKEDTTIDEKSFQQIEIPEEYKDRDTTRAGKPQIPYIKLLIAVPDSCEFNITAYESDYTLFEEYLLYPIPRVVFEDSGGCTYLREVFAYDTSFYQKDTLYPDKLYEVNSDGYWRDQRVLEVFLYPVQFNPQKKLMYFYHGIDLRIEYTGTVVENENGLGPFEGIGREILLNYPGIDLEPGREDTAAVHYYTDLLDTTNVADYIIVTHNDFIINETASYWINKFAEWRVEHNEFDVGIVEMQDVYTQFPSLTPDSAAQLRDFLIYAYDYWLAPSMPDGHFAYCLFIGDWDYVPTKLYTYPLNSEIWLGAAEGYFRNIITGSKDDIMLGRWPVKETKVQDLVTIAQKTINYEQSPTLGDWRRRGFLIAAIGAGFNFDTLVTSLKPYFSDINYDTLVTRYSQIQNDPPFLAAIDNNLNAGEIVTTYCGHGGPAGWWGRDMGAHYSSSRVKKLKNGSRLPVVLSGACFTAMFQWDHPFYDSTHSFPADTSFGEHFLIKQNGGAVAFWGATESVSGGAVDILTSLERMLRKQNWILGMCLVGTEKVCLLGDPALDLGDYTAYPNLPDLVVRPRGIDISLLPPYPYLSILDTIPIQSTVWNIGGTAAYDVDVRFRVLCNEQLIYDTTVTIDTILPRDSVTVTVYWNTGLTYPNYYGEIGDCEFKVRADPNHSIQESWEYNNGSMIIKNVAIYPHQPGWPKKVTGFSQPAIANLDGVGSIEIVHANLDSVYVYNYDGSVFSGWPQYFKNVCGVVLGDVDNNDTIEIVAVSYDTIKVYDYQGNILTGWPKAIPVADYYFRGLPAIGCIDSAVSPEIIVLAVNVEVKDTVKIFVYTPDGVLQHEFNSSYGSRDDLKGASIEDVKSGGIDEIVLSYESTEEFYTEIFNKDGLVTTLNYGSNRVTSALVDINNDNYADVIIGCSDGKIRAYDVENDRLLWERQTEGPINSSSAVGDIHPAEPGVEVTFGNNASRIHLREKDYGDPIDPWPYVITPGTYIRTSPAIANINGDDYLDIIIGDYNNYIFAFNYNGSSITPFPLPLFGEFSSPIIGDIDGDRKSEVIISSSDGYLHVWENLDSEISPYLLEWPQFHHDHQRTGLFAW